MNQFKESTHVGQGSMPSAICCNEEWAFVATRKSKANQLIGLNISLGFQQLGTMDLPDEGITD